MRAIRLNYTPIERLNYPQLNYTPLEQLSKPKPKIFQIGFNKCGTTSIYKFFKNNQFDCIHWDEGRLAKRIKDNFRSNKKLLDGIDQYVLYTDMEDVMEDNYAHVDYYKLLDQQYPGSKFILNTRNIVTWLYSRLKHARYLKHVKNYHIMNDDQVVSMWRYRWKRHHSDVASYFKGRTNLLTFNIEENNVSDIIDFFPEYKLRKEHWGVHNKSK